MLRNIFPDEPHVDQDASDTAEDPGTYFAEFLPSNVKVKGSPQNATATTAAAAAAQHNDAVATAAAKTVAAHAADQAQPADAQSKAVAAAAAAAAACEATNGQHTAPATAAAADEAADSESSDFLPSLPSISELKAKASAWFCDDDSTEDSTAKQQYGSNGKCTAAAAAQAAGGKEEHTDGEEGILNKLLPFGSSTSAAAADSEGSEEGLLDKLLPFGKDSSIRQTAAGFKRTKAKKQKPLRLKLAEQVLSKEMLTAVQVVESEILSSPDPLPSATLKFFLKAGRTMGQGWAHKNATRVFGFLTAYVAATCGVMHGAKAAAKWLAWRVPRVGKRVTGPAVSFTADVLLPTSFFGPCLATYVLVRLICKPPKNAEELEAEAAAAEAAAEAAAAAAAVAAGAADAAISPPKQQQQQQQLTKTPSRGLQLEFVVEDPPASLMRGGHVRGRRALAHASSLKGRVRNRMGRAVSGSTSAAAAAADEGVISADAVRVDVLDGR